jgi:type IV fimbrial biogenesis protein FimT
VTSMFLPSNTNTPQTPATRYAQGFSMIELMITIAVAAILLALALPSFTSFLNANRVTSQANELLATFQIARMESIRRGREVVVCGSSNANAATPSCTAGTAWLGWIAFVDTDRDDVFDTGETLLQANLLSGVSATASSNVGALITFRPDGLARRSDGTILQGKVALCVATTTPAENARDVAFALGGGRLTVTKRNATVTCSAPTN